MPEDNKKDKNVVPADNKAPQDGASAPVPPTPEAVPMSQPGVSESAPVAEVPKVAEKTDKPKTTTAKTTAKKSMPTQIGKDTAKPKNTSRFLLITGLSLAGLFVLFVILMVLMIAGGGSQSPILTAFGLDDAGIKSFLLGIVNLSFGFLALIFFVLGVIGIFRMMFAKKGDKEATGKGLRMTLIGILPLILVMVIWMFLYSFINRIVISSQKVKAEIAVITPTDLTNLSAPLEITFSSENVVKNLQTSGFKVTAMKWDLNGDGVFETIPTDFQVSYLYNNRGNYNVGLEVTAEGEDKARQYFYPLVIGEALFSADPSSGTAPLDVQFDASKLIPQGKKVQSMDWDFDNNGTYDTSGKDSIKVTHKFEQIGTFKVHLRVVYDNNLVDNYYRDIEITASAEPLLTSEIDATPSLTGQIPLQIRFDGGKSTSLKGAIIKYEWDFGDGSPIQNGKTVSKIFDKPGTYNVTLTVTEDSNNTTSSTVIVEAKSVTAVPVAGFTTTPAADSTTGKASGEIPFKVDFDASKSTDADNDIVDYSWDFGVAGATQTGQKVSYTYETAGTYTVTLTVTDSQKQTNTSTLTIDALQQGVHAVINATPEEGTAPLTVNFDGSSSSAFSGNIVSYTWDFGDKSPVSITSAQISHKYNEIGSYEAILKVTTNQNETGTTKKTIYVREIPLKACFTPSRRNGDAPLAVTFDAKCSTGTISKFSWDFNDGATSNDRKPAHTFDNPNTYNVTLEVTDDKNNVNTFSDVIVVTGQLQ